MQGVQEAISASPSDQPPLPPYPDISDLAISGKETTTIYLVLLCRLAELGVSKNRVKTFSFEEKINKIYQWLTIVKPTSY